VKQWASMGSFQGKPELITRCENCKAGCQEGRERKMRVHIVLGRMSLRISRGT